MRQVSPGMEGEMIMDSFDVSRMVAMSAAVLAWMIGVALLIAIAGALVSALADLNVWMAVASPVLAVAATFLHTGRSAGRHAYSRSQAVSEGIRKAGRSYRLTPDGWQEVTA